MADISCSVASGYRSFMLRVAARYRINARSLVTNERPVRYTSLIMFRGNPYKATINMKNRRYVTSLRKSG